MNEKIKALALAATGFLSNQTASGHSYGGGYYYEPAPISRTFNTSTCVGVDRLTALTSVMVEDYASPNNRNANAAAQATKNLLQGAWNNSVVEGQGNFNMLWQSFQMNAEYAAAEASSMYGVNVQVFPQTYSIVQGGCGQPRYYAPPRHHHHHHHHHDGGLPFPWQ